MNLIGMQLQEKKNKILVICPHPVGYVPGQRLKYEQYFKDWEESGFEVTVSPFMSEGMQNVVYKKGFILIKILGTLNGYFLRFIDLFRVRKYNIIYLFLWGTPFGPPIYEWILRKLANKIIYDIDDLVFLKNANHANKLSGLLKGKEKPIFMMKNADHVITCTPYLDTFVRKYNNNTTDISSTIDTVSYKPINKYENKNEIIIGWSGSHSTSQYLYLLKDVLLKLQETFPFKLLVMGDPSFKIDGLNIEAIEWKEDWEISTLQRMDIGVYPLPLNDEWVLGKSGLKALQYMALGIATIATNVGCNDRVIVDKKTGFLVKTEEEWYNSLLKLLKNPLLRSEIGLKGRNRVETYFSIEANKDKYLNILKSMID